MFRFLAYTPLIGNLQGISADGSRRIFIALTRIVAGLRHGHSTEADGHPIRGGSVVVVGIPVVVDMARERSVARGSRRQPPGAAATAGACALHTMFV